jgi:hypothetical protein
MRHEIVPDPILQSIIAALEEDPDDASSLAALADRLEELQTKPAWLSSTRKSLGWLADRYLTRNPDAHPKDRTMRRVVQHLHGEINARTGREVAFSGAAVLAGIHVYLSGPYGKRKRDARSGRKEEVARALRELLGVAVTPVRVEGQTYLAAWPPSKGVDRT